MQKFNCYKTETSTVKDKIQATTSSCVLHLNRTRNSHKMVDRVSVFREIPQNWNSDEAVFYRKALFECTAVAAASQSSCANFQRSSSRFGLSSLDRQTKAADDIRLSFWTGCSTGRTPDPWTWCSSNACWHIRLSVVQCSWTSLPSQSTLSGRILSNLCNKLFEVTYSRW